MPPTVPTSQRDEMHVRDLVEVAVQVVQHANEIVIQPSHQPAPDIESYWSFSSSRFARWGVHLKQLRTQSATQYDVEPLPFELSDAPSHGERSNARALLEEIFLSEPLTRIWAAILTARDRVQGGDTCEPVARSIQKKHAEYSRRALQLITFKNAVDWKNAVVINRLRRRAERWGDVLIARLNDLSTGNLEFDVNQFAYDSARAKDFAHDFGRNTNPNANDTAWSLAIESLRSGITRRRTPASPNADLNYQIAWNIASCFDSKTFDATGPFRSLWLHRLELHTDEAQALVDEYLGYLA